MDKEFWNGLLVISLIIMSIIAMTNIYGNGRGETCLKIIEKKND